MFNYMKVIYLLRIRLYNFKFNLIVNDVYNEGFCDMNILLKMCLYFLERIIVFLEVVF